MSANEMGQGERALTRAAGLVAEAKRDFDAIGRRLDVQIVGLQGRWTGAGGAAFYTLHQAWIERQKVITNALNEFESSLVSTERDNLSTDDTQAATYRRTASRLG